MYIINLVSIYDGTFTFKYTEKIAHVCKKKITYK